LSDKGVPLVVLGGSGFVGSAVVAAARQRGIDALAVSRANYAEARGMSCDVLVNANGNSKKYLAAEDPAGEFELSVSSVMRSLADFRPGLYVHLSSIDVYPDHYPPDLNRETCDIRPERLSAYGFHKYLAELLVRRHAARWLILRMGGFVGPGLRKNSIYDLLKARPLRVHADSEYQYLHTSTLGNVVFDLVDRGGHGEIFNAAGAGTVRLSEVASWIPGCDPRTHGENPPLERYEVDTAKLGGLLPLPSTRDTVRRFVADALAGREALA
jgi:nucleoside-diphosphate-sugar epimerase